ncbi:MAG: hypothetical protein AAGG01_16900 [Planctomycetota bacterium]
MNPLGFFFDVPTYANARLRLGISGVGTFVVLSLVALGIGLPAQLFAHKGGAFFTNASLIAVWVAGAALLALPFEMLGGYFLPRKFGRKHPDGLGEWFLIWLRGVLIVALTMSFSGAIIIVTGRYGGSIGAMIALLVILVLLISLQTWFAKLIGGLKTVRPTLGLVEDDLRTMGVVTQPIVCVDAQDEGFTGGISGPPTAETLVIPSLWFERMEPESIAVLLARRTAIVDRSLRTLGLIGAMGWTLLTFALATLMPAAGVYSVEQVIGTSLWFTVFSFLGLLILPTPSRAAAIAADAFAAETPGNTTRVMAKTIEILDGLQDDEPSRPDQVETIFHPIPSVSRRLSALESPKTDVAPWHIARTAIYLSIAGMNPLSRLVHCNVGRPELWVFLPADG